MKQYLQLLDHVLTHGESHDDRTGVGTLSVFGYQVRFDLREGFPLVTTKKIPFRWIAEELFWFLRGSTNEHELEAVGVDIWKEWATEEQCAKFTRPAGDLGPVYGWLWRHFGGDYIHREWANVGVGEYQKPKPYQGVDQISRLLNDLTQNPNSRRHLVTGWDPKACDLVALPPCHTLWQVKVHPSNELSLHLYARSIDSFLGLPFNIASYGLLLSMLAACTGYKARDLVISFGDLHIYKNHIEQVKIQLKREPRDLPLLHFLPIESDDLSEDIKAKGAMTPLEALLAVKFKHLKLIGYDPWSKLEAPVAI